MSMWQSIVDTTTSLLRMAHELRQNREEVREIRKELRDTVGIVERLKLELEQVDEREERERQLLMLRMENLLLRNRELAAPPEPGVPV